MALLSFRGISTPSLPAQGEQRRSSYFNIPRGNSQCALVRDLATDKAKREMFDRLARHLDQLADEVERAMDTRKTG